MAADRCHGDVLAAVARAKDTLLAQAKSEAQWFGGTKVRKVIALLAGEWASLSSVLYASACDLVCEP